MLFGRKIRSRLTRHYTYFVVTIDFHLFSRLYCSTGDQVTYVMVLIFFLGRRGGVKLEYRLCIGTINIFYKLTVL